MKQQPILRLALSVVATSVLVIGLVSCASPEGPATLSGSENSSDGKSETSTGDAPERQASDCDWGAARLVVADYTLPSDQQGELAEALIGSWQFTHYDLGYGGGWESWEEDNDRRYVFADSTELVHCVILKSRDSPSELGATYSVAGDQIMLDNDNGFTAIAWTSDTLLLSNHQDDSVNLFHRR